MINDFIRQCRFIFEKCKEDQIGAYAAQSALWILISSFPFLMLLLSLVQFTPVTERQILDIVNEILPEYIAPVFNAIIREIYNQGIGRISLSLLIAVWSSSKGLHCLTNGLNRIHQIKETRDYFRLRFSAILDTLVLILVMVVSLVVLVFGEFLQTAIVLLGIFIFFFAFLYKVLPNRKLTLTQQLPGSILCALAWYLFSAGISIYMEYFNGFSIYGSLTTIVLLLLWLYFCIYIFLICGEINCLYEEKTA